MTTSSEKCKDATLFISLIRKTQNDLVNAARHCKQEKIKSFDDLANHQRISLLTMKTIDAIRKAGFDDPRTLDELSLFDVMTIAQIYFEDSRTIVH